MYIVEIEDGVYLAPWDGDPGRTLVKESAKKFKTKSSAMQAKKTAQSIPHRLARGGFPNARIEGV